MKLTKRQLATAQQALGYAVMYAKTEEETAEFVLLKLDIDGAIIRQKETERIKSEHEKMNCSNPKCEGKCRYSGN